MVGRLTLFHDPNYKAVKGKIVRTEIDRLRGLTPREASERFGQRGRDEEVFFEFAEDGALRVFVIGTLCGGTCSGACVEFGYLLRSLMSPNDRAYLLATLPHHQLTRALNSIAERLKKNAYTALVEMNHYLVGDGEARKALEKIRFPDGSPVDSSKHPYDIVFLAQTEGPASEKKELLNLQLADVVYNAIFSPETDPWAKRVDAQTQPERDQAYAFSTLGVSALEFPVYTIIDGCRHRLLYWTILEWLNRSPKGSAMTDLEKIGFSWEKMLEESLITAGGDNLNRHLNEKLNSTVQEAMKGKVEEARKSLRDLRNPFDETLAPGGTVISPGSVMMTMRHYVEEAPERLIKQIKGFALGDFLDLRSGGFQRMSELLLHLSKVFAQIRGMKPIGPAGAADQWLDAIEDVGHSILLGMLFLRKRVRGRLAERLKKALEEEMRSRKEKALVDCLKRPSGDGMRSSSALDRLEETLRHYKNRYDNLKIRLTRWQEKLKDEYERLRDRDPVGNGVYLFEPGENGTVDKEFEELLASRDPSTGVRKRWEDERDSRAGEIIRKCQEFGEALTKIPESHEDHWLDTPPWQTGGEELIPEELCQKLLSLASEPFKRLAEENVLERWKAEKQKDQIAKEVMQKAEPFLRVSPAEARRGGKSEYPTHAVLLVPSKDTPVGRDFMECVRAELGGYEVKDSPDPYRVVAIKYIMGFPLKAAEPIYSVNGLHTAECTDWPNFHARCDVAWRPLSVGLSDTQKEIKRLFAVALLLNLGHVVEAKGGALIARLKDPSVGSTRTLEFPLNLSEAARLCEKGYDRRSQPVGDTVKAIQDAVSAHRRERGAEEHIRAIQQGYNEFSKKLIEDWHDVPELLGAYYKSDPELKKAWEKISPPTEDTLKKLWDEDQQGYRCQKCGAFMGTKEDFGENNWTCPKCGDYYGSAR
jgi:rubrerythrin